MSNETNPIQPDEQAENTVPHAPETDIPEADDAEVEESTGDGTTVPPAPETDIPEADDTELAESATEGGTGDAGADGEGTRMEDDDEEEQADDEDEADFRGILEALIFASDEPLTFRQIKELLAPNESDEAEGEAEDAPGRRRRKVRRLTITRVKRAIDRLNDEFAEDGRVFRIVEVAGGFAFQTTKEYGAWVGRLFAERSRRRLTQSALETLAIIAFKQPISKPAIEGIRGVNAEYVVKSLLERNLISIVGREDSPGRPLLYGTTKTFLKHFGLSSINDLPKPREIKDLLSSEDELAVNPIDEMDPDAAALLTRVSSQELEKLFENAQTKADGERETEAPVLHVQFDSESEPGDDALQRAEFESGIDGDSEGEGESESGPGSEPGDGALQRAEFDSGIDGEIEDEVDSDLDEEELEPAPGDEVEPEDDEEDFDEEDEDDLDITDDNDDEELNR